VAVSTLLTPRSRSIMAENLQHMLDDLKQRLLLLSGYVEEGAAKVVSALMNRDVRLAESVVLGDQEIDRLEVQVETECEKILVLQGPVARDMRFVVASLKISSYLERMGDLTKKIGKNVVFLCGVPPTDANVDFREIARTGSFDGQTEHGCVRQSAMSSWLAK
ncbi:MAG: PhoU domain-containing protein, partial [Pirellulales bacterium]